MQAESQNTYNSIHWPNFISASTSSLDFFHTQKKKPYLLGMEMGKPSTKPSHTFLSLSSTTSQMINTNPRIRQTQPQEQPHK